MSERFTPFGILLHWVGLIPLCLMILSNNIKIEALGVVILIAILFVWVRCHTLGLVTIKVKRPPEKSGDRLKNIAFLLAVNSVFVYFAFWGFNGKVFITLYFVLITLSTLYSTAQLNVYEPGEPS